MKYANLIDFSLPTATILQYFLREAKKKHFMRIVQSKTQKFMKMSQITSYITKGKNDTQVVQFTESFAYPVDETKKLFSEDFNEGSTYVVKKNFYRNNLRSKVRRSRNKMKDYYIIEFSDVKIRE